MEAQTQKKWSPEGWIPEGWSPKGGGPKISRFFFPPPATVFFLLSLSWGPFVEFWWCLKRRGPEEFSGCRVRAARSGGAAGVSHDSPRAQTCTFQGPGLQKHQQNSTKGPQGENCGGRREKKERNFGRSGGGLSGGGLSTDNNHNNHSTTTTTPHNHHNHHNTPQHTTTHHIKSTPHHTASPQHTKSMTTWIEATGLQHTRVDNKKCVFDFGQFRLRPISTSANFDFGQFDFGLLAEVGLSEVELAEVEHPRQAHLRQGKQECSKPASNQSPHFGPRGVAARGYCCVGNPSRERSVRPESCKS